MTEPGMGSKITPNCLIIISPLLYLEAVQMFLIFLLTQFVFQIQ